MTTLAHASRDALIDALAAVERDVADFFGSLTPDEFVVRVGPAWTPAEQLAHLNTSVSVVAGGFAVPRLLLRLRFGRARRPSRDYDTLRDEYRARLADGSGASGRFIPERTNRAADQADAARRELLDRWRRVNQRLRAALAPWSERDLDRILLPHPLLGSITAREMVLFTLYHGAHHIAATQGRMRADG